MPEPGAWKRAALLASITAATYPVGLLIGHRWILPALNTVPAYMMMVERLRAGDRGGAVRLMLVWAGALAVFGTLSFALWPRALDGVVLNGPGYREEMWLWIRTGFGTEGSPRLFLPQHLLHLAVFVVLCLTTASALSILLGAVLMNYMAFYVASLAKAGLPAWGVILLGWQPWAICRVAAFCVLGAVLAEPVLARVSPYPRGGSLRPYLYWAGAGILADWILKALLAPTWGHLLRGLIPS